MDVRCERCKAQYVFDDDQITSAGLTVQCTNCGHLFRVKKKELVVTVPVKPGDVEGTPLPATPAGRRPSSPSIPAVAATPTVPEHAPPREWCVRQASGNVFTFRELTTLQKWIVERKVARDDEISLSGEQWKRLGNIGELASFFQVVEAAERSRTAPQAPSLKPLPGLAPLPRPVPGAAARTPVRYPPPPPSGFPPPAFATPPAPPQRAQEPQEPPPAHDVDLGMDDAPSPRRGAARWVVAALVLAVLGGGGYLAAPLLLGRGAPRPAALALAREPKPPPPPAAPPPEPTPAPAPVAAPQPIVELPRPPPEPVKPVAVPPKGPKVLLARAKALLAKGDSSAALELFGHVASQDPDNVEAQVGRGLCYLDLENWAPAEASFQAALRLQPDHADALLGLAETYRFRGQKTEALAAYERYLARYPDGEEAEVAKNALAELRK